MANNNYPQIISVTSEQLQAQIRNLLPSQEGFGTDLMAQNVIVPVIDLTSAAEGSTVPQNLQTALAFGSNTAFSANNSTAVIANTPGFWRITMGVSVANHPTLVLNANLQATDGATIKNLWAAAIAFNTAVNTVSYNVDLIVFLAAGETVTAYSNSGNVWMDGSARQIADVNGNLVNPSGFTPQ